MKDASPQIKDVVERVRQQSQEALVRRTLTPYQAAWAAMALAAHGDASGDLGRLRDHLVQQQLADGRVVLDRDAPEIYWPTALAVLAWGSGANRFAGPRAKAVQFLLQSSGKHWQPAASSVVKDDPSIRGWSWTGGTHSWVEPTSLAVMALKVCGRGSHPRVAEAVRMLLDRQLSTGGWNYGNTVVFGAVLRPTPEDTGYALAALADSVERSRVEVSLRYLQGACRSIRTPASLAWALHGLSGWDDRPAQARAWIAECLGMQKRLGVYGIRLLSQLVVCWYAQAGLVVWARETE